MLKKLSILLVILVMILCTFYKPSFVKAKEDKIYVIELPSNEVSFYSYTSQIRFFDNIVIGKISDLYSHGEEDIFFSNGERDVLKQVQTGDYVQFEYYDGATEEECIFDITSELREDSVKDFGRDILENYTKVQIILKEYEIMDNSQKDFILFDLSHDSFLDMTALEYNLFDSFELFDYDSHKIYNTLDGKTILNMTDLDKEHLYEWGDISSEDDIEYTLEEEDLEFLLHDKDFEYIDLSGYEKVVLSFGDAEYDESYYVVDFKPDNYDYSWWDFFAEKGLVKRMDCLYQYYDSDGKELFQVINDNDIIKQQELTYENTIEFDFSEDEDFLEYLDDKYSVTGVNRFIIKFANPEVVEGNNQEYNSKEDDSLIFRLNIPFDKFLESGEVYLDDELVDSENYTASEGSTIITFKKDYLDGLDSGEHTLRVNVEDGSATATFSVTNGSSNDNSDAINDDDDCEPPKTGDGILLYLGLFLISSFGFLLMRKRINCH